MTQEKSLSLVKCLLDFGMGYRTSTGWTGSILGSTILLNNVLGCGFRDFRERTAVVFGQERHQGHVILQPNNDHSCQNEHSKVLSLKTNDKNNKLLLFESFFKQRACPQPARASTSWLLPACSTPHTMQWPMPKKTGQYTRRSCQCHHRAWMVIIHMWKAPHPSHTQIQARVGEWTLQQRFRTDLRVLPSTLPVKMTSRTRTRYRRQQTKCTKESTGWHWTCSGPGYRAWWSNFRGATQRTWFKKLYSEIKLVKF